MSEDPSDAQSTTPYGNGHLEQAGSGSFSNLQVGSLFLQGFRVQGVGGTPLGERGHRAYAGPFGRRARG